MLGYVGSTVPQLSGTRTNGTDSTQGSEATLGRKHSRPVSVGSHLKNTKLYSDVRTQLFSPWKEVGNMDDYSALRNPQSPSSAVCIRLYLYMVYCLTVSFNSTNVQ